MAVAIPKLRGLEIDPSESNWLIINLIQMGKAGSGLTIKESLGATGGSSSQASDIKRQEHPLGQADQTRLVEALGDQPATHLLVNPIIQGALLRSWPLQPHRQGENSVLGALRHWWGLRQSWPQRRGQRQVSVLDFGLDLTTRPGWLAKSTAVHYRGLCLPKPQSKGAATPAPNQDDVVEVDWTRLAPNDLRPQCLEDPPQWVLAVDVLDHLEDPLTLLRAVATLYRRPEHLGHMLVVTRNAAFFKEPEDKSVQGRKLWLRSRRDMRRYFRDAGLEILDETSLPLPSVPEVLHKMSEAMRNAVDDGMPPLHFWVLRLHMTRPRPVKVAEIDSWILALREEEKGQPNGPAPRHESARLILEAVHKHLEGVHWREVAPGHQLLSSRNSGGRLFIVRTGEFVGYHPDTLLDKAPVVRLTRGANEVAGELEVFDQRSAIADRLYMMSLYAAGPVQLADEAGASALASVEHPAAASALVIPASTVQLLLDDPEVLKNPLLRELRSKTLEAELGLRHAQRRRAKDALPQQVWFGGRYGQRLVPSSAIAQVACLLERAMEFDREWGLPEGPQGRVLVFIDLHLARTQMFGRDNTKNASRNTNAALQFLERCGAIRPLCLNTQVAGAESALSEGKRPPHIRERLAPRLPRPVVADHVNELRVLAEQSSKRRDIALEATLQEHYGARTVGYEAFKTTFLKCPCYGLVVVRSEYLLRRLAMDMSAAALEDLQFLREVFDGPTSDALMAEDRELVTLGVKHLVDRSRYELAHVDSCGLQVFARHAILGKSPTNGVHKIR